MEEETKYYTLIFFVVFLFFKKIIDLVVEAKFPTYEGVKNSSSFWQNLVKLESVLEIVSSIFVIYFLMFFNLNHFIKIIFIIILLHSIKYFLIEERYVFLFVDDSNNNKKIIDFIDIYLDGASNVIISMFALFALVKIFV
jgi:hypothetical protein